MMESEDRLVEDLILKNASVNKLFIKLVYDFLNKAVKKYGGIDFITSAQLGNIRELAVNEDRDRDIEKTLHDYFLKNEKVGDRMVKGVVFKDKGRKSWAQKWNDENNPGEKDITLGEAFLQELKNAPDRFKDFVKINIYDDNRELQVYIDKYYERNAAHFRRLIINKFIETVYMAIKYWKPDKTSTGKMKNRLGVLD